MANHNPEDSAGAQLAMLVAVQLLLSSYRGNADAVSALETGLEQMRALLLASAAADRKIFAFEETAESLLQVIKPDDK